MSQFSVSYIYRSKLWFTTLLALGIVFIGIPVYLSLLKNHNCKPNALEGKQIQKGNKSFYGFLDQIKKTNGLLILGTSETANSLEGYNYPELLNQDSSFTYKPVVKLAGAGRSPYVYFPHILNNPEAFKDQKIVFYINPTYWRYGLNTFHKGYYKRYVSADLIKKTKPQMQQHQLYERYMKAADIFDLKNSIDPLWNHYKSLFFHNLNYLIYRKSHAECKKNVFEHYFDSTLSAAKNIPPNTSYFYDLDTMQNVSIAFAKKKAEFPSINETSDFQYKMLEDFIVLSQQYQIDLVLYLGPFNQKFCAQKNPEKLASHQHVIESIKRLLTRHNIPFIDGSQSGNMGGTFLDVQHISTYEAFVTAQNIKRYYENRL